MPHLLRVHVRPAAVGAQGDARDQGRAPGGDGEAPGDRRERLTPSRAALSGITRLHLPWSPIGTHAALAGADRHWSPRPRQLSPLGPVRRLFAREGSAFVSTNENSYILRVVGILTVRDLNVTAGQRALVRGLSFSIAAGECVALLGASGSGKSLTAESLLGTLPAGLERTGRIELDGADVSHARPQDRAGMAAVFQATATALNPLMRVGGQFRLAGHEPHEVAATLADLDFDDPDRVLGSYPMQLSGGQRQRVCLALAVMCRPRILVADEPTSALDTVSQAEVISAVRDQTGPGRAALLFITHDVALASGLCERAMVMHEGRIVADEDIATLLARSGEDYVGRLVSAAHAMSELSTAGESA
ncbi:ABC transporter ATP-binding protein [Propionibacterium australiense]|uniref:ABC transporter ATP-binding protein n=1 Tax=Propionibacterium australiense TaxID=119981 RepID=A0A8B3FS11_9ACTN|nr:ABC transporter ATP-binding protein [Propionibacterium australiense]